MFYILVMVYELLLKGENSDHFKKDEKEHQWVELSWDGSAHVILVLFDRTASIFEIYLHPSPSSASLQESLSHSFVFSRPYLYI